LKKVRVAMKGVGYSISTVSVLALGAVAWPGPHEPEWKAVAVVVGMAASIIGMVVRYLSHRKDHPRRAQPSRPRSRLDPRQPLTITPPLGCSTWPLM
jgi:hypothetical protein